ncbi:hypothetical protein CDV55_107236 [Aspergillus turcosus]|nr:hypothetical protein CDV55_107236 [Aspergillus turcosus]
MAPVSFQIMSDLHLETHSSYDDFQFQNRASYLALLGDIGHVENEQLYKFLEHQIQRYLIVFFVFGNHEPYHMSFKTAKKKMRAFEAKMEQTRIRSSRVGRFVFLDQTRYDISDTHTVLGCTLFSHVTPQQEFSVESLAVDFKDILHWTVDDHNLAHESDLKWLNAEVSKIAKEEPQRQIFIFTHHCPTMDSRCMNHRHKHSDVTSAFMTDLSSEECWTSTAVKMWAFGHTHYNCQFTDDRGKVILANQKGYQMYPQKSFDAGKAFSRKVVVENSLKIWYLTNPTSGRASADPQTEQGHSDSDLVRLIICGEGVFRITAFQAVFSIAAELRAQIYEDDSLSPLPLRQDLLQVIRSARDWHFRWLEAGETNIKGYILACALAAQIEGLLRGFQGDDIPPLLVQAVEEADEKCLPVLEEMAAALQTERAGDALPQVYVNLTPDLSEDWDFMMSDIFRDPGSIGSIGLFDNEAPLGPAIW